MANSPNPEGHLARYGTNPSNGLIGALPTVCFSAHGCMPIVMVLRLCRSGWKDRCGDATIRIRDLTQSPAPCEAGMIGAVHDEQACRTVQRRASADLV